MVKILIILLLTPSHIMAVDPLDNPEDLKPEVFLDPESVVSSDDQRNGCDFETWAGCDNSIEVVDEQAVIEDDENVSEPGWTNSDRMAVVLRDPPSPQCPMSGEEAVSRLQTGLEIEDVNLALTFYDWAGMNNATSEARIDQFLEMNTGLWVKNGINWRWVDDDGGVIEFKTVKRGPCTLLRWENEGKQEFFVADPEPIIEPGDELESMENATTLN